MEIWVCHFCFKFYLSVINNIFFQNGKKKKKKKIEIFSPHFGEGKILLSKNVSLKKSSIKYSRKKGTCVVISAWVGSTLTER